MEAPGTRPKEAKSLSEYTISPAGDPFSSKAQDHPHACLDGFVYLGYVYEGEDGEEYEAFERIPCRRCREAQERATCARASNI